MTPEQVEYIRYRLSRAEETLREARFLVGGGFVYGVVNRLYYACFYAVSALLYTEGRASSKHSGIKSMFDRHWVNTGRVSAEMGRLYRDLFDRRQDSDYGEVVPFDRADVEQWLAQAEEFVKAISEKAREKMADERL